MESMAPTVFQPKVPTSDAAKSPMPHSKMSTRPKSSSGGAGESSKSVKNECSDNNFSHHEPNASEQTKYPEFIPTFDEQEVHSWQRVPVGGITRMDNKTGKNYFRLHPNLRTDPYYGLPACLRNRGPEVTSTKKERTKVPSTAETKSTETLNVNNTAKDITINDLTAENQEQPEFSLLKRKAKSDQIDSEDCITQPKSKRKIDIVQNENVFDVLEQDVMDRCKVCKKDTKRLLSHLSKSSKCKEQYNIELLKQEQKEKRKQYNTKYINEKRNEKRNKDEAALQKAFVEEKSKQRQDKRNKDEAALQKAFKEEKSKQRKDKRNKDEEAHQKSFAEEKSKQRQYKRNKDDGAFKRERAYEQKKNRESKRNKDEAALQRAFAEEKSKQRQEKRNKNDGDFKRERADEQKKVRESKRKKDEGALKKGWAEEKRKQRNKGTTEFHRRRLFFDAIRDGPIFACVCCRRIRFRKQVKIFDSNEITEKSPLEDIVEKAIGDPPENLRVKDYFYICSDCLLKVSKGKVPSMSHKNGLDLVDLEGRDELKLTELENALIAKNILFQMFVQLPKSRMTATKKQMVSIPIFDQDIVNTMQSLPRMPSDAGIVKVQLKRKKSMKNTHLERFISPNKLIDALRTLKQLGNKHYQFVGN